MAYLKGSGIESDPYVIHNEAAMNAFLQGGAHVAGVYAELAADIDASGLPSIANYWRSFFNGNGYTITGLKGGQGPSSRGVRLESGKIEKVTLNGGVAGNSSQGFFERYTGTYNTVLSDVVVMGAWNSAQWQQTNGTNRDRSERCINLTIKAWGQHSSSMVVDSFKLDTGAFPSATDLYGDPDPYNPAHYPALTALPDLWIVDGASPPRLKPQPVEHLIQGYAVKGNVSLSNLAAERTVVALAPGDFRFIAETQSAPDGSFFLPTGLYADHVFVMALEHYGRQLLANKSYALGEIVHPQQPNGYRYTCTTAGNSGATLPEEPWPTGSNLIVGAAVFTPSPVYAPAVHGPVKPILVDLLTQEPV